MGKGGQAGSRPALDYRDWMGRSWIRSDVVSDRLIAEYRATFPGLLGPGEVPSGLHWALAPDLAEPGMLGLDGHPRPGLFVPALPLPRRMWAGGEITLHGPLSPGERVERETTVTDITFKQGATGLLGFVTLRHVLTVAGRPRLEERQDLVYRGNPESGAPTSRPPGADPWDVVRTWTVTPDPVLLFRYSALTFNGHRIHYDLPYATGIEGYAGLVVHGPMQAVWMLNLAGHMLGRPPTQFRYRGLSPLICGIPVHIEAAEMAGEIALRVRREDGGVTMQATATP
ncbi:MAG: MaoC family dehydratase N-terminal domain-containing protein [Gemmobacter sp.]|jgi:3-methylfumaryl-CoA hydratase|nr:MaoC family dehydratase N-terminal domain-containing protein [Gemmobacter sp.]